MAQIEFRRSDGKRGGDRVFRNTRIPVTFLADPFQWCVALVSSFLGAGVIVSSVTEVAAFTSLQGIVPLAIALVWGGFMLVGGLGVVFALAARARLSTAALPTEIGSLMLLGTAWTIYGIAPLFGTGFLSPIIIGTLAAVACAFRVRALILAARVTRESTALRQEVT